MDLLISRGANVNALNKVRREKERILFFIEENSFLHFVLIISHFWILFSFSLLFYNFSFFLYLFLSLCGVFSSTGCKYPFQIFFFSIFSLIFTQFSISLWHFNCLFFFMMIESKFLILLCDFVWEFLFLFHFNFWFRGHLFI